MTIGLDGDRLSWGDALFLYLERAGMPLNIASLSLFEGEISLRACTEFIASKLPLLPRYYQRVVVPPLNIGFPTWEYDPKFDIHNHIREIKLKRGSEAELKKVAGKLLGNVMDRQRPLWDFTLLSGVQSNRTAIITRIHHCLADGVAGVGLMNVLLDPDPEPRPVPLKKKPHIPRRQRDPWTRLLDGWLSSYSDAVGRLLSTYSDIADLSQKLAGSGSWPTDKLPAFLSEITAPTQRLFFNVTYQGPQRFAYTKIPVSGIKAVREKLGGTFNDVILTIVTSTIRRYVELHGDNVRGRLFRMMVPVNVRGCDSTSELGNRILLLPVTVPLGIRDPKRLLNAVHKRMDFLKNAQVAELFGLAGGLIGAAPAALQALVGPVASLLPVTPFNLVCTNIRGPNAPLYLLGHKMIDWYPYVPVGGEMALNCAVLSYDGMAYFGFSGDVHAAPDIGRLESLLRQSFIELQHASTPDSRGPRKVPRRPVASSVSSRKSPLRIDKTISEQPVVTHAAPKMQQVPDDMVMPAAVAAD